MLLLADSAVFALVFALYHLPVEAVGYALAICAAAHAALLALDYRKCGKKRRRLEGLRREILITPDNLPEPESDLEAEYQELLRILYREKSRLQDTLENQYKDLVEYYTIWAHQIKSPIAAMSLILQGETLPCEAGARREPQQRRGPAPALSEEHEGPAIRAADARQEPPPKAVCPALSEADARREPLTEDACPARSEADEDQEPPTEAVCPALLEEPTRQALSTELRRIEQYVEMVLCYLRLDAGSTDYVIREYDLDSILRQAIRRQASFFIRKKISLNYKPVGVSVITDEKWLLFVIEQILSNALKYTASGSVTITLEPPKTLCVRDTGIGIAPEDLPRVFEKGYTGYNGRTDKKASGIGLYLCRRICGNLGHRIRIDSAPGEGTRVYLELWREELEAE